MYKLINNLNNFNSIIKDLNSSDIVSLDVETTGLDPYLSKWLTLQLKLNDTIYIVDIEKLGSKYTDYLISLIENKKIIAHNAKFDIKIILHNTGILLKNIFDTFTIEQLIYMGLGKKYPSYKELVEKYVGETLDKKIREEFIKIESFSELTHEMLIYSALDVQYLENIKNNQKELLNDRGMNRVANLEMKLLPVVTKMEYDGVLLDKEKWLSLSERNKLEIEEYEKQIKEFAWNLVESKVDFFSNGVNAFEIFTKFSIPVRTKKKTNYLKSLKDPEEIKEEFFKEFNIGSTYQLQPMLRMYGIPVDSTSEKVLKKYKEHKIIKLLLEYKEKAKLVSTYGENFVDFINPVSGRIHAEFNSLGTATGRFSSNSPNLQNVPRNKEYRSCFIAREGYSILTIDYSQQEFRLIGAITGDPLIIEAYKKDKDIHTSTGAILHGVPLDEVTEEQRYKGKTMNFALAYGSTKWGISYNMGISLKEAEEKMEKVLGGYKIYAEYKTEFERRVLENKYSTTILGRKRYFREKKIFDTSWELSKYENRIKREGFNHLIQGTGADITKQAKINVFYNNPFSHDELRILMTEHDELVVEIKDEIVEEATEFVSKCMLDAEKPFLGEIPAKIDYHIEKYWKK